MELFAKNYHESVKPGFLDFSLKKKKNKDPDTGVIPEENQHIIKEMESRN